jgi:hypothetical protein
MSFFDSSRDIRPSMHLDAIQGLAEPLIAPRWQSRLSLAVTVVCLAALEIYIGAGVVVVLLPLLAVPRLR